MKIRAVPEHALRSVDPARHGTTASVHADARILILDDEYTYIALLEQILRSAGYRNIRSTTVPTEALAVFSAYDPDIVLLDLHMPQMDGIDVLRRMHELVPEDGFVPMLMLTGDLSRGARKEALSCGAMDFVNKPVQMGEVLLRIRNLLQTRMLHLALRERNRELACRVQERTRELEQARLDILYRLARAADFRDDMTGEHTRRVGRVAERVATALRLPQSDAVTIGRAAMLHDIGKIGIPDNILLKPASLTASEFDVIKQHTVIGREILSGSEAPLLQVAEVIAYTHHERWDGGGYHGLSGESIPLAGRIVTVTDTFDALTNDRPYRPAQPVREALDIMEEQRGAQFDPYVLDAFMRVAVQTDTRPLDETAELAWA